MQEIESEKTTKENIVPKIEKINALIQQLIKEREGDFTSEKERITIFLFPFLMYNFRSSFYIGGVV